MASEKVLEMKKAQVAELAGKMTDSVAGVLVEYKGINVADDTNLRRELREAGIDYSVIKNSIIMQGTVIGAGCHIENTIIDKNVTVSDGVRLVGAPLAPCIVEKGETV